MIDIVITFIIFSVAVLLHITLFRTVKIFRHNFFTTTNILFVLMGLVNIILINQRSYIPIPIDATNSIVYASLPIVSTIIYTVGVLLFIQYFDTVMTFDYSPSVKIINLISKKKKLSYSQIRHHFSTNELIGHRLDTLVYMGLLYKKKSLYHSNTKGVFIDTGISLYRRFLGWNSSG